MVKNLPANAGDWETQVQSLGREDPLEKDMATPSIAWAWKATVPRVVESDTTEATQRTLSAYNQSQKCSDKRFRGVGLCHRINLYVSSPAQQNSCLFNAHETIMNSGTSRHQEPSYLQRCGQARGRRALRGQLQMKASPRTEEVRKVHAKTDVSQVRIGLQHAGAREAMTLPSSCHPT